MKQVFTIAFLISTLVISSAKAGQYNVFWQPVQEREIAIKGDKLIQPLKFQLYSLNDPALKTSLLALSTDPAKAAIIDLPTPNGNFRSFRIWQTPIMEQEL